MLYLNSDKLLPENGNSKDKGQRGCAKLSTDLVGYAHPNYALSLQEFGEPRELPRCGGWILVRPIPGTPYKDAIGCYPLFACRDWTKLHEDLEHVGSDLVSLVLVTDSFAEVTQAYLGQCFDIVKPFKTHYVSDFIDPQEVFVSKGHRVNARTSLKKVDIEICLQPVKYLDDWITLYDNLISRHRIKGISAFSSECFKFQLTLPGMLMALGRHDDEVLGATLFLTCGQISYTHLTAHSITGYKTRVSYAIRWKINEYLYENGIRYLDNGGGAGNADDPQDGLAQFKRGWSNDKRLVYLCGRIFDRQKYESICQQKQTTNVNYFPAYRVDEF